MSFFTPCNDAECWCGRYTAPKATIVPLTEEEDRELAAGYEAAADEPLAQWELDLLNGTPDAIDHPSHYTGHPSGVECIDITEHMSFLRGNAVKYLWRAGAKGDALEDLRKARWYIDREIAQIERGS